jgi:hypothetical protein
VISLIAAAFLVAAVVALTLAVGAKEPLHVKLLTDF